MKNTYQFMFVVCCVILLSAFATYILVYNGDDYDLTCLDDFANIACQEYGFASGQAERVWGDVLNKNLFQGLPFIECTVKIGCDPRRELDCENKLFTSRLYYLQSELDQCRLGK